MAAGGWLITDATPEHCDPVFASVVTIGRVNRGVIVSCQAETVSGAHALHKLITGRRQCALLADEAARVISTARQIAPYMNAPESVVAAFDRMRSDCLELYRADPTERPIKAEGRRQTQFEYAILQAAIANPDLCGPILRMAKIEPHPTSIARLQLKPVSPEAAEFAKTVHEMIESQLIDAEITIA
jgi:hypothetical protein